MVPRDPEAGSMPYLVTENCTRCNLMDCMEFRPVECVYAGEAVLVIRPEECIGCGVCNSVCPAKAIARDSDSRAPDGSGRMQLYDRVVRSDAQGDPTVRRRGTDRQA